MNELYNRELSQKIEHSIKSAGGPASAAHVILVAAFVGLSPATPLRITLEALIVFLSAVRMYHCRRPIAPPRAVFGIEIHAYACLVTLSTLCWSYLLMDLNRLHAVDPSQTVFVLLTLIGICAAGATSLALMPKTYVTLLALLLILPSGLMIFGPTPMTDWPAIPYCLLAYAVFLLQQARIYNRVGTDLIRAEIWSAGERDHLNAILNAMPNLIICVNRASKCVSVNQAVVEFYQRPREDFEQKSIDQIPLTPALAACLDAFVRSPADQHVVEVTLTGPSTPRRHLVSMRKLDGPLVYAVLSSEDIEDEREAQAAVLMQQAVLEHSAKMAALGTMAGGIAHEINNPLAIISGKIQTMRRHLTEPSGRAAELDASCQVIVNTVSRIAKIIHGMRQISRDGTNDPFEIKSLSVIVEECLPLVEDKLRTSGIQLVKRTIPPDVMVACRSVELSQVLVNLISNSVDAIGQATEWRWIDVTGRREGEWIVLSVTDSGRGIPEDVRQKIMQPFFTTKEVGQGTGIGLSISSGIAQAHGGRLELDESCPNTRFNLYLPVPANADV